MKMNLGGWLVDDLLGEERPLAHSTIVAFAQKYNIPVCYRKGRVDYRKVCRLIFSHEKNNPEKIDCGLYVNVPE